MFLASALARRIGASRAVIVLLAITLLASVGPGTRAQDYPTGPIRVLIPFAPGGVVDTSARILTDQLTQRLGWRFVLDNRPGDNGFIAVQAAAKARPDGHTLLTAHTGEFAISPAVFKRVPYDLDRDFIPITMLSEAPMVVVANSAASIDDLKALVAIARAKPRQVSYGSQGIGSIGHLTTEWLAAAAGVQLRHVAFKGGAPAVAATATGEVTLTVVGLPAAWPHIRAGRIKVIGVTTATRVRGEPWMTPQEGGIAGVDASVWVGLFAPKGTPAAVIDRIYREVAAVLKLADVRERFATAAGAETVGMPPDEFRARIARDLADYRRIALSIGLNPQ